MSTPRWFTETNENHSQWYVNHFRKLMHEGADLSGEARFLDALVAPGSRILDAGCGQGRTAGALAVRGHTVCAVDVDDVLIAAAREDNPGPSYRVSDIAGDEFTASIEGCSGSGPFDAAISAGNVITYTTPGTEVAFLRNVARVLRPDAPYVVGFHIARYNLDAFDADLASAGFKLENRFASWDIRPSTPEADFAVSVLRAPAS